MQPGNGAIERKVPMKREIQWQRMLQRSLTDVDWQEYIRRHEKKSCVDKMEWLDSSPDSKEEFHLQDFTIINAIFYLSRY